MHDVVELVSAGMMARSRPSTARGATSPSSSANGVRSSPTDARTGTRDPQNILSPGVILTDDPESHLKNLQTAPVIEADQRSLHPVRALRAVCSSRNHDDAATANALRREMARQPESSPCRQQFWRTTTRRDPDLRGRRQLRDRLPGRHQHRHLHQAPAASEHGPRSEAAASAARHFVNVSALHGSPLAWPAGRAWSPRRLGLHRAACGVVSKEPIPDWSPHTAAATSSPATRREALPLPGFTAASTVSLAAPITKPSLQEAMVAPARAACRGFCHYRRHCCANSGIPRAASNGIMANRTVESLWRCRTRERRLLRRELCSSESPARSTHQCGESRAPCSSPFSIRSRGARSAAAEVSIRRKVGAQSSPQLLRDSPRSRRKAARDCRGARRQGVTPASAGCWICR